MTDKQKLQRFSRAINKLDEAAHLLAAVGADDLAHRAELIAVTAEKKRAKINQS